MSNNITTNEQTPTDPPVGSSAMLGRRVWYTGGGSLITGIVEIHDPAKIFCEVRLADGTMRSFGVNSLHKSLQGAIWGCEDSSDYWQCKATELTEELRKTESA